MWQEMTKRGPQAADAYLEAVEILVRNRIFSRASFDVPPDIMQAH
jgi:hypothetical protein